MLGYLIWRGAGWPRAVLERRAIGGAVFWVLEARGRERRLPRRVRRALDDLTARGVRQYVVPPDWPAPWRQDLTEVEESALRQAMLSRLLDWLAEDKGIFLSGAAVELSATHADPPVWEAAGVLARRCRYLRLRMEGADTLKYALWRRYGIAAGGGEGPALLQICFAEPRGTVPALLLGPGCGARQKAVYGLPEDIEAHLDGYPPTGQLTAALWMCGAVKTEEIRLKSLDFPA